MPDVQHKRGTRAALDALATGGGLKAGQIYAITDESRLALALTASTYQTFTKDGEAVAGVGTAKITVSSTAPASPATGDLWVDIS